MIYYQQEINIKYKVDGLKAKEWKKIHLRANNKHQKACLAVLSQNMQVKYQLFMEKKMYFRFFSKEFTLFLQWCMNQRIPKKRSERRHLSSFLAYDNKRVNSQRHINILNLFTSNYRSSNRQNERRKRHIHSCKLGSWALLSQKMTEQVDRKSIKNRRLKQHANQLDH